MNINEYLKEISDKYQELQLLENELPFPAILGSMFELRFDWNGEYNPCEHDEENPQRFDLFLREMAEIKIQNIVLRRYYMKNLKSSPVIIGYKLERSEMMEVSGGVQDRILPTEPPEEPKEPPIEEFPGPMTIIPKSLIQTKKRR